MPSLNTLNIYIVKPKEATNLVTNPSFEKTTTGYTAVSSTIARTNSEQRRGAYGLEVTPTTGVDAGVYFGTVSLVAGTEYTFSVDVKGVAGQAMRLQVRNTSGVSVGGQTFVATGYWQRVSMSYTETVTNSRRLYAIRDAVASTDKFYLDGFQMEAGAESTYFDGDMKGYVRNRADFRWLGAAHASQSWRSGNTKKGGELVNLKTLCNILGVIGLGMTSLSPQALETTLPGSLYQRTSIDDREFSIPVLFGGDNFRDVALARKSVIDLIRPDAGSDDQPITMVFETVEANGTVVSERASIAAHYTGGLEMKITGGNQRIEKATLNFRSYLPFITSDGTRSVSLLTSTVFKANSVLKQTDGVWSDGGSASGGGAVYDIIKGPDGSVYYCGAFFGFSGVPGADNIVRYDGVAFTALGTGLNASARKMAIGPDGNLYVVGNFSSAGGVPNTQSIAMWDGSAWNSVGALTSGSLLDIVFSDNGDLYTTGTVDGAGKVLRKQSGGSLTSILSYGFNTFLSLATDGSNVYAGGTFDNSKNGLAKYDGAAWSLVGTGITSGSITSLAYDRSTGKLYIAGSFAAFNGVTSGGIGYWNGSAYVSLGSDDSGNKYVFISKDGGIYMVLDDYDFGGKTVPGKIARYYKGTWVPARFTIQPTKSANTVFEDPYSDDIYIGLSGTRITIESLTMSIQNMASVRSSPVFNITGPGILWEIKNYTTRQTISFTNLTLSSGETLTLDLTPGQISFTSNYRGNMMRYIVPGSNLDLFLQAGVNNLSAFMTGTDSNSQILMTWQDTYWSLDGTVR